MNWLTHFIEHTNRHGRWVIQQEDGSGRFSIHCYPTNPKGPATEVFLGNTRTPEFAIFMLRAGETRHPNEINPADCSLPEDIKDWAVFDYATRHPSLPDFGSWKG